MRDHVGSAAKPLVGLFLLLLVFFVLLTAGVPIDPDRSQAASESLTARFAVGPTWLSGETGDSGAGGDRAAGMPRRLSHLFATELSIARVQIRERGRIMQAEFPVSALFDGEAVRPALRPLLQRIGGELGTAPPGQQASLDIFFHGPALAPDDPAMLARASALARTLADDGAPASAVRLGTESGDPAMLRLEFSLRRRDDRVTPFHAG